MAYIAKIGQFQKKEKSTRQPNIASWEDYNVVFKDGADLRRPIITLNKSLEDIKGLNYVYLLDRYYFIAKREVYRTNYCILYLELDLGATFKNEIGSTAMYILRTSNAYDGRITDGYYPPIAELTSGSQIQDLDTVPQPNFNSGFYLMSVMGTGGALGGAEIVYRVNPTNFKLIINGLYTSIDGVQLEDALNWVYQKVGGNPQELLSSVVWVPYWDQVGTSTWVRMGSYQTEGTGYIVSANKMNLATYAYNIPKHPKSATKGEYLNLSPYSDYKIYIPGSGIVQLDSSKLIGETIIYVDRTLDIKGQVLTTVRTGEHIHAKTYSQMGVPISLNGNNSGGAVISGLVSTTIAGVGAALTGGAAAILGAVGAGANTIANTIGGASSNTSSGAISGIGDPGRFYYTFYDIPPEDNANNGRPYCQTTTPASLGGYMIVQKGVVEIDGTLEEERDLNSMLESGFYYE